MKWRRKEKAKAGFTIVELLIVIVVIAVLSAVAVAAYSGITEQARKSVFLSDMAQGAKSMELWKIQNGDVYPDSFAMAVSAGLLRSTEVLIFQGSSYSTSPDRKNYCITGLPGSNSDTSDAYSISSTSGAVAIEGVCITNLVRSPEATMANTWHSGFGTGGVATESTGDFLPDVAYRGITWGSYTQHAPTDTTNLFLGCQECTNLLAGRPYFASYYYRATWATSVRLLLMDGSRLSVTSLGQPVPGIYRAGAVITFGSNQSNFMAAPEVKPTPTMTLRLGGLMAVEGSDSYEYGDGSSEGWYWNGDVNNSTSTGPSRVIK